MAAISENPASHRGQNQVFARTTIAFALVGVIANALLPKMLETGQHQFGLPQVGVSKLVLFCAALGLIRLLQTPRPVDLIPVLVPAGLGAVLRSPDAAWLGLAISMAISLTCCDLPSRARDGAAILFAVGLHAPLVSNFGFFVGSHLLVLDAQMAAALLSLSGTPVSSSAASLSVEEGMDLILVWRCGVLGNLSIVLLTWYATTRYVLGRVPLKALKAGVLVAAIVIASNVLRISGMALSAEAYAYLHTGQGATLLRLATLSCIALIIALNLRSLER